MDCNSELGHPCDADSGEPCTACKTAYATAYASWRRLWEITPLQERDPVRYVREMEDAGREHLLEKYWRRQPT